MRSRAKKQGGISVQAIMETVFDLMYFGVALWLGVTILRNARGRAQYRLFGWMALLLVFGDAFHLVPRMIALNTTGFGDYLAPLGVGKLVTSITATDFYTLLYHAWRARYGVTGRRALTVWVWALTLARIALCLFPQNGWTSATPPLAWGIYRNLPFVPLGVILMVLFYRSAKADPPLRFAYLAILLSFTFYLPVVMLAEIVPPVGMLMIPKTLAYVWLMVMALRAQRRDDATR